MSDNNGALQDSNGRQDNIDAELVPCDSMEVEVVSCTADDLIPASPLQDIVELKKFQIIGFYPDKYNQLDIIPVDAKHDEEFRLNEDLLEAVELDADLQRPPKCNDVVLAQKNGSYRRAVLVRQMTENTFLAYFVDAGGQEVVEVDKLKPVTKAVMMYPTLAYHVILDNLNESSYLFLKEDYICLIEKISKEVFSIKFGEKVKRGRFTPSRAVFMWYKKEGKEILLNDEIDGLKKWEWERFSGCKGTDNDLCEHGGFGGERRTSMENTLVIHYSVKVGAKFTAIVSSIGRDDVDPNAAVVTITMLDDPDYRIYFQALHRQLQRYSVSIQRSQFYPALDERLMFKLITTKETKEKYTNLVKQVDKWCRGVRFGEMIYLLDFDDTVPFKALHDTEFEIRRIYGEFFNVPILTLKLHVKRRGQSVPYDVANKIFQRNAKFAFQITANNRTGIYEAEFGPAPPERH